MDSNSLTGNEPIVTTDPERPDAPSDPAETLAHEIADELCGNSEAAFEHIYAKIVPHDARLEARARLAEAKEWNKIVRGLGMSDDEPHQAFQAADERIAALESAARECGGQT